MAAKCALYPHNWAVWGGFNKINKLTGRPPPAPEARGGQSLTKDQFVIAPRAQRHTLPVYMPVCSSCSFLALVYFGKTHTHTIFGNSNLF